MSLMPQFLWLHPILLANIFLLFALDKIFSIYKSPFPLGNIFDSAALISLASLFYLPAAVLLILLLISILILRAFAWRNFAVAIIGFIIPYLFVGVYYFWNENFHEFRRFTIPATLPDVKNITVQTNIYGWILFSMIAILFLLTLVKAQANFYKNVIRTRKFQMLLLFFLAITILIYLIKGSREPYHFSLIAVPLSVFIAYYFLAVKKIWMVETFLWIMLIVMIVQHVNLLEQLF